VKTEFDVTEFFLEIWDKCKQMHDRLELVHLQTMVMSESSRL
jgi:hypothetical protein